ncbi:MAG: hypothetical protein SF052_03790 [Bacteroidia bacterium]|nr:hypothetical protein [Bacteroidia bacterium]
MTVITVELIDLRVKALLEDLAKMNLIQTWTQEELDAYEYAFMREEDERARLDKAKQDGKFELVIELFNDGMPLEKIAKLSRMTVEEVKQIVD